MKKDLLKDAKNLYVQINADGERRYRLEDIAIELQKATGKKINLSTISRWAARNNWEADVNKLRMRQIEKIENKICFETGKIQEELYEVYKMSRLMVLKTANQLIERLDDKKDPISTREIISANRTFLDSLQKSIELAVGKELHIDHSNKDGSLKQENVMPTILIVERKNKKH